MLRAYTYSYTQELLSDFLLVNFPKWITAGLGYCMECWGLNLGQSHSRQVACCTGSPVISFPPLKRFQMQSLLWYAQWPKAFLLQVQKIRLAETTFNIKLCSMPATCNTNLNKKYKINSMVKSHWWIVVYILWLKPNYEHFYTYGA